jgi:hypothetical protein
MLCSVPFNLVHRVFTSDPPDAFLASLGLAWRGLKEAWSKVAARWTRTGYEAYPIGRVSR